MVTELRDCGFRVAIDDVVVGHSGLSQLKGLGANTIKIDKFFVGTITVDASTTTIVEMLVALARELHMTLVTEGVESEDQVRALIACGVDEAKVISSRRRCPARNSSSFPRNAIRLVWRALRKKSSLSLRRVSEDGTANASTMPCSHCYSCWLFLQRDLPQVTAFASCVRGGADVDSSGLPFE